MNRKFITFYHILRKSKICITILTVAVCLTDEDITTGFMAMLSTDFAKVMVKQLITKNNEIINLICVNASFRIAELFWLYKSIEMSTIFMERKTL